MSETVVHETRGATYGRHIAHQQLSGDVLQDVVVPS